MSAFKQTSGICLLVAFGGLLAAGKIWAISQSRYEALLVPFDIYAPPEASKKLISRNDLYRVIAQKGLPIKIARETLKASQDAEQNVKRGRWPKLSLTGGENRSVAGSREVVAADGVQTTVGTQSRTDTATAGFVLSGEPITGVSYSFNLPRFTQTRTNPSSNPDEQGSDLAATSELSASLGISLLKNNFFAVGRLADRKASLDGQIAREQFRGATLDALLKAEQIYYDLVQKQIRYRIAVRSLDAAKALMEDVQQMIAAGESDRLSLVKIKLQVSQSEVDLLTSRSDLGSAKEAFREVLGLSEEEANVSFPDPHELKADPAKPKFDAKEAIERALKTRSDYRVGRYNLIKAKLDVDNAFYNKLPQLDFKTTYGSTSKDTNIAGAYDKSKDFHDRQLSLGLELTWVLTNFNEQSAYRQAVSAAQKAQFEIEQLDRKILKELQSLYQKVEIGFRRLSISSLTRELAEEKLKAEFSKFRVGESGIRNIIDFQNEYINSQVAELSTRLDVFTSVAQLRNALGQLPEGVEFSVVDSKL